MIKNLLSLASLGLYLTLSQLHAQVNFINESFNGTSLPAGWTSLVQNPDSTDGGFKVGPTNTLQSEFWPIPAWTGGNIAATNDDACNCNKFNDRLVSPTVDLSAASNVFISFDYFFIKGTYQGKTEEAFLEASTDGANWTVIHEFTGADNWRNYLQNISQFAGEAQFQARIRYRDNNGWLYGFAVDNFRVYQAPNFDMAGISLNLPEYALNNQPLTISGTLRNLGATTINSLVLNYQVNNGTPVSAPISSLNVAAAANFNFTHPQTWTPNAEGFYTIKVWADALNGNNDQVPANDTLSAIAYVSNQLAIRKVMFEQFTSNTCGPCASIAPTVSNFLNTNGVNTESGKIVSIKYHQNFPAPGTDAAYTAESNARRTFYGFGGIPAVAIAGNEFNGHPVNMTQAMVDQVYARPTIFNIDVRSNYVNNTVNVEVDLTSLVQFNVPNTRIHVAIIEDRIQNLPGGTTSQTIFTEVNRKMLPNQSGSAVPNMSPNQTQSFTFTHTLSNVFSSMNGISVVAFVQNNTTREVYQANSRSSVLLAADGESFPLMLFPNPSSDQTFLSFETQASERVMVRVFNLEGKLVKEEDFGRMPQGVQLLQIDNNNLQNGLYLYQIIKGDSVVTRRVSIAK
jgi:thiol-disulfide isomerase/thioredoxin